MQVPLVTVYMPAFNSEKYIAEAIDSILKQTFHDFEFIIIDDGSTDKTVAVILSFKDIRIRLIRNETNIGIRKSSNIGLKEAKGKYIARMDSDDVSLPSRLQKQVDFMKKNPAVGASSGQLQLFGNSKEIWKFPNTNDECKAGLIFGTTITQPASIIRTSVIRKHNLFYEEEGEPFAEDWQLWYKMKDVTTFANIDEVLLMYRRQYQNVTHQLREKSYPLNSQMHKRILNDFGIDVTENELMLHQLVNGLLPKSISLGIISDAKLWLEKLIKLNEQKRIYQETAFINLLKKKWASLFYHLPPYGNEIVNEYYRISTEKKNCASLLFFSLQNEKAHRDLILPNCYLYTLIYEAKNHHHC